MMTNGRMLERDLTNRLYGAEIADIMERFEEAPFQVQVWRDLAVARYKLYDATGIWLRSRRHVQASTYSQVEQFAQDYLDQKVVPAYFQRLKADPHAKAPELRVKAANYATRGFVALPEEVRVMAVAEFCRASLRKEDWFYALQEGKFFVAENETGGYTLMLADEY